MEATQQIVEMGLKGFKFYRNHEAGGLKCFSINFDCGCDLKMSCNSIWEKSRFGMFFGGLISKTSSRIEEQKIEGI